MTIRQLKSTISLLLRDRLDDNWVKVLQTCVNIQNQIPRRQLGWLAPNQITADGSMDGEVRAAQRAVGYHRFMQPSVEEQKKNQLKVEKSPTTIPIGTTVLVKTKKYTFSKDFDAKISIIIFKVYATQN